MTTTLARITQDKVLGVLLGGALGDALGAPFEGRTAVDASEVTAWENGSGRLEYTEDTAPSLVLASHVIEHQQDGHIHADALAQEFARAWRAEPWRGYGTGTPRVFGLINAGVGWADAARASFHGQGSYGNGAAMRAAPAALVARSLHHAAELGERSAEVTHAHKHGRHGAACQAAAAYLALHSDPGRPLDATRFVHDLRRVVRSRPWHDKLDRVAELARWDNTPEHAARALGNDVSALGSVPAALLAFLAHADAPADTIRFAILGGGDTDTIAAMAGALAGARHGSQVFPEQWLTRLEAAERLRTVAEQLRR